MGQPKKAPEAWLAAPIAEDDEARLKVLRSYEILDTTPEPSFDDITLLASNICGTPIALVSLVDENRQWFKSRHGLDATQTGRDESFCGHAIQQTEIFEVRDATKDPRFANNPLVVAPPNVIFYAGAPLMTEEGQNVGTLCVIDSKPGKLTEGQKESLAALSRQVVFLMELRKRDLALRSAIEQIRQQSDSLKVHQSQLVHNAKMVGLGQMAGGVAHEINNPLTIILGLNRRIRRDLRSEPSQWAQDKILSDLASVDSNIHRIVDIVAGMLTCSRTDTADSGGSCNLSETVDATLGLFREKCQSRGISLSTEIDPDIEVEIGPVPLSQIVINLLNNSYDALENSLDRAVFITSEKRDDRVILQVADSGSGIPENLVYQVCEPFFTTKPIGHGTGLGLSISSNLAESCGGSLEIQRGVQYGAKVNVVLPIVRKS